MEKPFNADALRTRIDRLSRRGRLAFLLSCAERLAANYAAFSKHHGWGDPQVLREALDLGWKYLLGEKIETGEVITCLRRCEEVTPDTEDFDSEYVSSGLDAAICCAFVLELVLKDDSQKVVEGASLARDTVDMHVQELESMDPQDPELEMKIFQHALMQRELQRQKEDLDLLEQVNLSREVVEDLARRWREPATSNIDRSNTSV